MFRLTKEGHHFFANRYLYRSIHDVGQAFYYDDKYDQLVHGDPRNNWYWHRHKNDPTQRIAKNNAKIVILHLLHRTEWVSRTQILNFLHQQIYSNGATATTMYLIENLNLILTTLWIERKIERGHCRIGSCGCGWC